MKLATLSTTLIFAVSSAHPSERRTTPNDFIPAGPGDARGPCPMMNTLANHAFLPHDGLAITEPVLVKALSDALNFNESLASLMFKMAIIANPEPNAVFFTLDQLNVHNVLEHDASLSRTDAFFGNQQPFDPAVFAETQALWKGDVLDTTMLANSKISRQLASKVANPNYTFTSTTEQFSLGEVAAPIVAFGDVETGLVSRAMVEFFFINERFPTGLGFVKQANVVSQDTVAKLAGMISSASSLITPSQVLTTASGPDEVPLRRNLHFGF